MSQRPQTRDEQQPERRRRKPLGTPRQRLSATVPKGMVARWFNDWPGRISDALEAGYRFIGEDGKEAENRKGAKKDRVGVNEDGSPLMSYLMAIPQEWYDEDQAAKQAEVDKHEHTIKRGNIRGAAPQDGQSYYVPNEGISVRHD